MQKKKTITTHVRKTRDFSCVWGRRASLDLHDFRDMAVELSSTCHTLDITSVAKLGLSATVYCSYRPVPFVALCRVIAQMADERAFKAPTTNTNSSEFPSNANRGKYWSSKANGVYINTVRGEVERYLNTSYILSWFNLWLVGMGLKSGTYLIRNRASRCYLVPDNGHTSGAHVNIKPRRANAEDSSGVRTCFRVQYLDSHRSVCLVAGMLGCWCQREYWRGDVWRSWSACVTFFTLDNVHGFRIEPRPSSLRRSIENHPIFQRGSYVCCEYSSDRVGIELIKLLWKKIYVRKDDNAEDLYTFISATNLAIGSSPVSSLSSTHHSHPQSHMTGKKAGEDGHHYLLWQEGEPQWRINSAGNGLWR